jgi:OmpA-OmpF porin, OOP family
VPAEPAGFALNRFQPADDPSGFLAVPSPFVSGNHRLSAALVADYAHAPLVLRTEAGDSQGHVVSGQLHLHAIFAYTLRDRVRFSLSVPFAASNSGHDLTPPDGPPILAPRGAALGDMTLGARVRLLPDRGRMLGLSAGVRLWLPSGQPAAYTGDGSLRAALDLVLGQRSGNLLWSACGAVLLRARQELHGVVADDELQLAAAAGYLLARDRLMIGPEVSTSLLRGGGAATTLAEIRLSARYQPGPLFVALSAGPGLGRAPGSPAVRLLVSAGWAPRLPPATSPALLLGSAPPAPPPIRPAKVASSLAVRPPPAAAAEPPPGSGPPLATDGDGDGIFDDEDRCPRERGRRTRNARSFGCPSLVRVTEQEIVTLRPVHFLTGRAYLHRDSSELLRQVAQVLSEHPEIRRISIEGHTDNRGGPRRNRGLSEARARAVRRWLVGHGIAPRRLDARGFGASRPLAPHESQNGRAFNRRVEFRIVDPAPLDVSASEPGAGR